MTTIARRLWILFFGLIFVFALAISSFLIHNYSSHPITIGAKSSTEGQILSEVIAQFIEYEMKIPVQRNFSLDGTFINFNALKTKDIDLYVEYTGSAYTGILKKDFVGKENEEILKELKEIFLKEHDIVWMEPLGFQNTYALMVTASTSKKYGIKTLSDLREAIRKWKKIRIGLDPEFYGRNEAKIVEKTYEIPLQKVKLMDHTLLYMILNRGGVEVINGYATDGLASGLVILEDDQKHFPTYEAIPIVHLEALNRFPKLEEVLKKLGGCFDVEEVQEMNYAVEKNGENIYDVAHAFLNRHNLIHEFSNRDH